jgi:hypothetical protein
MGTSKVELLDKHLDEAGKQILESKIRIDPLSSLSARYGGALRN